MVLRLSIFVFLLLPCAAVSAVDQPTEINPRALEIQAILARDQISLGDLLRLADLANPTLAAAENAAVAAAGYVRQAGSYPNPTLGFDIGEMSASDTGNHKEKLSLHQSLVIGGRRGAAIAAAQADQELAKLKVRSLRLDILARTHTLWVLQKHYRDMDVAYAGMIDVADRTLEIARIRFEAKAAPESQVTRALLEVYALQAARRNLTADQAAGAMELQSMLDGMDFSIDCLSFKPDEAATKAEWDSTLGNVENHPAVQMARRSVDGAQASLRASRAARVPDLGLHFAYGKDRGAGHDFLEAGISLPLPIFNRNQGSIAAHHSEVEQARYLVRVASSKLQTQYAVTFQRYQAARDQLEVTANTILSAAERGLTQAQVAYRVGNVSLLELIDAQTILANISIRTLELRRDSAVAVVELMSLTGTGIYGQ